MSKIDFEKLMSSKTTAELKSGVVNEIKRHYAEVLGEDEKVLDKPDAIDLLYDKYFKSAA